MWNRVEVKAKGKAGFKRNYWNCVVASLLFTLVSGGLSGNEQRITRQVEENYMDPAALLGFITSPKFIGGAAVGLAVGILVFGALEVGFSRHRFRRWATALITITGTTWAPFCFETCS